MTTIVKESYRPPREAYYGGGRYPDSFFGYEEFPDITWENVSQYATSADPMDRVAAHVFVRQSTLRLDEAWLVIEDPSSPNLNRGDGWPVRTLEYQIESAWSAHLDEADAQAWCAMFQEKSDDLVARHPWWGNTANRKFVVVFAAGGPVNQLRQPGATPWTGAFE